MNLFQSALKRLEIVGISRNYSCLNAKALITFTCFWVDNIFNFIYLIREVNGISELANSIFITSATTVVSAGFVIIIINASKIYRLEDISEIIVDLGKI